MSSPSARCKVQTDGDGRARPSSPRWVLPLLLGALTAPTAHAHAAWTDSPPLAPAVKQAADQQRLLLVKVGTSWCSACRQLERVLAEAPVRQRLARYLTLSYDAEEGEGQDVARRYHVVAYPTLLLLGADGREIGRITGDERAPRLLALLEQLEKGGGTVAGMERALAARSDDLALRLEVGTAWALRGDRPRATAHLDRVMAGDPNNRRGLAAKALLVRGKFLLLRGRRDWAGAARTLRELRARFPDAPQAAAALYPLAQALHGQQRTEEAIKLLESQASDAAGHERVAWFCLRHQVALARGLDHARRTTALAAHDPAQWANLAALQSLLGREAEALDSWTRAAALAPDNPRYRLQRDRLRRARRPPLAQPRRARPGQGGAP